MSDFARELKTYADNGFRTSAAWLILGREVATGSTPRTSLSVRGQTVDLFTRDQTQRRPARREA